MAKVRFGTDGWRAVMAEDFTFDNVERVAAATARIWKDDLGVASVEGSTAVVGYDRRFQSDSFARCAAATLARLGFRVVLTDCPTPTPAVSLAVARNARAVGGLMITASHNPPEFNGIKLKAANGGPVPTEFSNRVEQVLACREAMDEAPVDGGGITERDLRTPYLKRLGRRVDLALIRRSGLRVAHDAMHGVGAGCYEALLHGGRSRVTALRAEHDPLFGGVNPEPIPTNCVSTAAWLRANPHDIGLVSDGDADRLSLMGGRGEILTTHDAIVLVLNHLVRHRGERGRVVTTPNTTARIPKLCALFGLPMTEVPIGFKHLGAEMLKGDTLVAVEESGSIGVGWHLPERDGILAGLLILEMLAGHGRSLAVHLRRLEKELGPHHYGRSDLRVSEQVRMELANAAAARPPAKIGGVRVAKVETLDGVKYVGVDGSWLMVRASGTEPIVRVYAEATSAGRLEKLLRLGRTLVGTAAMNQKRVPCRCATGPN
ncbi:MAG: phosphoglucomutase/phosphomannomutase family protein [Verrucomicrobiales bacterium]|nr:phosphoglucomutase/phosphomannomutase family protein [Verrucomicrobiales bacterium]